MPSSALSTPMSTSERAVWRSLKQAIAESSGFQRWQQTHYDAVSINPLDDAEDDLEQQVRRYLRETLATLAY